VAFVCNSVQTLGKAGLDGLFAGIFHAVRLGLGRSS
jgi:hypothetical protein